MKINFSGSPTYDTLQDRIFLLEHSYLNLTGTQLNKTLVLL